MRWFFSHSSYSVTALQKEIKDQLIFSPVRPVSPGLSEICSVLMLSRGLPPLSVTVYAESTLFEDKQIIKYIKCSS